MALLLAAALPALGAMNDWAFVKLCEKCSAQQIRAELMNGANPNARGEYGNTALMYAAEYNKNPEVVSILLKAGADVNTKSDVGMTALMLATEYNKNPEVISVLLKAGADINAKAGGLFSGDGDTALMLAAKYNTPEVISVLLKAGADINAKNKKGMTALDVARKEGNTGAVKVLEEAVTAAAQAHE